MFQTHNSFVLSAILNFYWTPLLVKSLNYVYDILYRRNNLGSAIWILTWLLQYLQIMKSAKLYDTYLCYTFLYKIKIRE